MKAKDNFWIAYQFEHICDCLVKLWICYNLQTIKNIVKLFYISEGFKDLSTIIA